MKVFLTAFFLMNSVSALASITIGAYNIRNFDYDERYRIRTNKVELSTVLKNLKADLLSIEEINNTQEWDKFVQNKMPGFDSEVTRCGGAHGQKLGFLYNKSKIELISFEEDLAVSSPGGRGTCDAGSRPLAIALFKIKSTGQKFFGITAHFKSGSQPNSIAKRAAQHEILKKVIKNLKAQTGVKDFFFAGDLNTTEYRNRGADFKMMNKTVKELGMVDVTSNLKCTAYYWGGTDDGIETPSMLDHIVLTPGLMKGSPYVEVHGHCQKASCREVPIRELGIHYSSVSDHCPITARIQ